MLSPGSLPFSESHQDTPNLHGRIQGPKGLQDRPEPPRVARESACQTQPLLGLPRLLASHPRLTQPREVMARPKVSDNDDANEKAWIAYLREWLRSQDDLVGRDTAAAQSSSPATAVPIGVSRSADSISPSTRPGHVRQLSQGSRQLPNATGPQPQVRPGHQRNPSSQGSTGPALSADSTMSPGPGHHRSFSQQSSVGHSPSELSASLSSSTGPPSGHQRKTSLGGSGSGGHLRTHSRSLSQTASSTSVSFRPAPLIEDAQEDGERPSYEPIDLPPFVQSAGEGFYPSPSPSPVEVRLKTHPIPSPVGPSGGPSSALEPVPARRLQGSHSRNASANIQPQRLSQILSSKKSLPDLRQPHAQIIGERQASGLGRSRIAGAPNVMRGVPSAGEMIDAEAALRQASSRAVSRKMSDDTLRRPITGSTPSLAATASRQPFYASCAPQESAILEVNPREGSRDSYFRRLSTLQGSTIPKSVPPSILALVDSARGLLFALSQVEQAIRQHSAAAIDNGYTGVLASVLGHAGEYTDRMIDSLDRFDSVSRRASMPPPAIIIGVIEASRDGVQKFGKVVDVFAAHTKMSAPKTAAVNDQSFADVRFARTLVLLLFGAIGEVAFAWKAMAPIIEAVAPLLRETAAASSTSSISSSQAQSWTPPPPPLPLSRQHHIMSSSTSSRTPISPIPERAESHSPASSSARLDGSPIVSRMGAPLPSSLLISSVASPPQSGTGSGFSTPAPTPGPPSQAARSKSRRHAGSFSTKDVQIGSHIPPMPSPQPNGHHREDSAVLETPVIPIGKSCSSPPGGRSTPLRSALRDPFMASPSTLQTTTSSPAPAVSTSYDILPFSASDPFPVPAGSSADSQQQQQPFLSPRPHQTQLPPPGGSSGPSIGRTPGESSSTTPETTSFVRYHPPAGGHSAQSSISSSVGTPVSPSMSRERSYFDGGGGPSSSLLDVVGSSGGGGAGGSSRVMDEELLDNIENGVEIALSVWVLLEQDLGWASVSHSLAEARLCSKTLTPASSSSLHRSCPSTKAAHLRHRNASLTSSRRSSKPMPLPVGFIRRFTRRPREGRRRSSTRPSSSS